MNARDVMDRVASILDSHGAGLLATVDADGRPRVRWLTPAIFPSKPGVIYALTVPAFAKVAQLKANPHAEWIFQTPELDEIVTVRGKINIVENPSLRSELLEKVGRRMHALWKLARDAMDLSVLETIAEEAVLYHPMEGRKVVVSFPV